MSCSTGRPGRSTIVAQVADLQAGRAGADPDRVLRGLAEQAADVGLERTSLFFDIGELHRARYGRAKRLVDVPLALAGVVVLAVVIPIVWLGNLAGNRGSLLYRQLRVGKAGQEFTLLKFRTMRTVDSDSTAWTTADDPRVTPFGRFLRRSHLDELPQVVNILRGDLSVVGPRPERPHYVRELEAKLPFYRLRHLVRPGLTEVGAGQLRLHG